ncbi:hypothetical protein [Coleofasciculus sp.]
MQRLYNLERKSSIILSLSLRLKLDLREEKRVRRMTNHKVTATLKTSLLE